VRITDGVATKNQIEKREIVKICILGSGNVAHHISRALYKVGHNIVQVYGRNKNTSKAVAKRCKAVAIQDIGLLSPKADLYLITVSDNAIELVARSITFELKSKQIIAHTAGSISIDTLKAGGQHFGSFYPLQTFSKARRLSFQKIPMCINGSDEYTKKKLTKLAKTISTDVRQIDDATRKEIHLSAVLACNFVTHLIAEAEELLESADVDPSILTPLIQETVAKTIQQGGTNAQTGPARRGDTKVISSHLKMLDSKPNTQKLYKQISAAIKKKYS